MERNYELEFKNKSGGRRKNKQKKIIYNKDRKKNWLIVNSGLFSA